MVWPGTAQISCILVFVGQHGGRAPLGYLLAGREAAARPLTLAETRWDSTGQFKEGQLSGISSNWMGELGEEGGFRQSLAHYSEDGVTALTSDRG